MGEESTERSGALSDERLVSISWYARALEAEPELARLRAAGLAPYLKAEHDPVDQPVEILVPESQYEAAREVLGIPDDVTVEDEEPAVATPDSAVPKVLICPECRSGDTFPVPSYAGRAFLASLVVLAVSAVFGKAWIGAVAVCAAWVVVLFLSRHAGKWRCRTCGWEFDPSNASNA